MPYPARLLGIQIACRGANNVPKGFDWLIANIQRLSGLSGQAVQPVPLVQLKLSMAVYGQKLDGRPPDEQPKQLAPPSFGRDVKLGVPCLDAACIVGLNKLNKLGITAYSK